MLPSDSLEATKWEERYLVLEMEQRRLYFFSDSDVSSAIFLYFLLLCISGISGMDIHWANRLTYGGYVWRGVSIIKSM